MINKKWIEKTKDYKAFVGNPDNYDKIGKIVFNLLLKYGLKPEHKLLDIGCGSLRVGKFIINYLNQSNYYGIDANNWLIVEALENENINLNKYPILTCVRNFDLDNNIKYNYILCNSVFIHACKKEIEKVFSQLNDILEDEGFFIFNYIEGKKDNEAKEWTYPSHICYTKKYIEGLLKKYNLSWEIGNINYPGKQTFIIARRKKC